MPRKNSFITATDQFCGAGGSTSGAKAAGVEVRLALNHWELAIETHNTNHPEVDHDCTDIQACEPSYYPSTDILITSPECTNHSLAKGKKRKNLSQFDLFKSTGQKPDEKRSRATMWDVCRFAEYHNYNCIIVENVVDARYWTLWEPWLMAMHRLGYQHKCVYLNSMFFFPCPQSRDRMYVVFWKKGNHAPKLDYRPTAFCQKCGKDVEAVQSWKKADKKWGKYKRQYVYKCRCGEEVTPYYYAAFNCIDFSDPGQRIGDRKKPLAEKTIQRIEYGLDKYANEFLLLNSSSYNRKPRPASREMFTVTGCHNMSVAVPFLTNSEHSKAPDSDRTRSGSKPIWTQSTTQSTGFVVPPFIIELNRTGKARSTSEHLSTVLAGGNHHMLVGNYSPGWSRPLTKPTGTVTTSDHHGLFTMPMIVENYGQSKSKKATDPIGAITTRTNHGIFTEEKVSAFLSYYYSTGHMASGMFEAANTMTAREGASLVMPKASKLEECFYRMLKPHEIQSAMAFADDYIIKGNNRQKVKQLGNAVTPPVMEWLVRACVESLQK